MSIATHHEATAEAREGLGSMLRRAKIRDPKRIANRDAGPGPSPRLGARNAGIPFVRPGRPTVGACDFAEILIHFAFDGTLHALGGLTAVNQLASDGRPIRLVDIEEPETALHPAAAGVLMGALREASGSTQVLVTTHSADLLDRYDPDSDRFLLATMSGGVTRLGGIDAASQRIIRKHLDTAGGLLRMDQLEPDPADLRRQDREFASSDANGKAE